jgi:hypothetical protein
MKNNNRNYTIKGLDFRLCYVKALASFYKFEEIARGKKEKQTPNKKISCLVGALGEYAVKLHCEKTYLDQKAEVIQTSTNKKGKFEKQDIVINFLDENEDKKQYKIEVKSQQKGYARCQILVEHAAKYLDNNIDFVFFTEINFIKERKEITIEEFENISDFTLINIIEKDQNKHNNGLIEIEKIVAADVEIYCVERPKTFFNTNKYEIHYNKFKKLTYIRKDCVIMLSNYQIIKNQQDILSEVNEILNEKETIYFM